MRRQLQRRGLYRSAQAVSHLAAAICIHNYLGAAQLQLSSLLLRVASAQWTRY